MSAQLIYYVYAYLRKDGSPYYIGKGKGNRAYSNHVYHRPPKDRNRIQILENNLSEVGSLALERKLIKWYGRKDTNSGILINKTDGGEGVSGLIHTEETRNKMSEAKKGKPSSWLGKTPSKETRFKMKNSALKRGPHSKEIYEKIGQSVSDTKKGKPLSDKHRAALKEAAKDRDFSYLKGIPKAKAACQHCNKMFSKSNLSKHEKSCKDKE